MNAKRVFSQSLLILFTLSMVNAQTDKRLLGAWKTTIDYETYTLEFISESQLILNGETYSCTLTDSNIVAEALLGKWENQDEYGMHKVTFHSDSQLEYDGEWVGYAIEDNAIIVDYEKYLFKMEGEALMVKWPGETEYRKYTRIKD